MNVSKKYTPQIISNILTSISPVKCFKSKADLFFSAAPKTIEIAAATSPSSPATIIYQGNFWLLLGKKLKEKNYVLFSKKKIITALNQHFGSGVGCTWCAFSFWVLVAPWEVFDSPIGSLLASILVCELCSPFTPKMTFRLLFKVIFITLSQEGPNRWEAIFRAGLATDVLRKSLRHHLWKNIWRLFTRVNP